MAAGPEWTFLSNHAHVLICIAREPAARLRDVAQRVGITEHRRAADRGGAGGGGYLSRLREGRRNRYEIHPDRPLRHPVEAHRHVRDLIELVVGRGEAPRRDGSSRVVEP